MKNLFLTGETGMRKSTFCWSEELIQLHDNAINYKKCKYTKIIVDKIKNSNLVW
ncbi:hypothetical protein [Clostridium sp. UBA6640]|uniref:hypothetical protein n=1 Tax=Clostridium sp. UBA6640 TaxID=1946370 RepID=UPI0025BA2400|nr:hypothetical protein [Clostridium sp. UBA6640]